MCVLPDSYMLPTMLYSGNGCSHIFNVCYNSIHKLGGCSKGLDAFRVLFEERFTYNNMFAILETDYEIRNQCFFAILDAMATN